MLELRFKRNGNTNKNGSVPGKLTLNDKTWPTVERGKRYTFVRRGTYDLVMDRKNTGRPVRCLRFDHDGARTHLIHDAKNDNFRNLEGCIAPGTGADEAGISGSEDAMKELFIALGGFKEGRKVRVEVENNIWGEESKDEWLKRRKRDGKW